MCDINFKNKEIILKYVFLDMRHPRRCGAGRGTTARGHTGRRDSHHSTPSTKDRLVQLQNN